VSEVKDKSFSVWFKIKSRGFVEEFYLTVIKFFVCLIFK
jgi:hypothetical protein